MYMLSKIVNMLSYQLNFLNIVAPYTSLDETKNKTLTVKWVKWRVSYSQAQHGWKHVAGHVTLHIASFFFSSFFSFSEEIQEEEKTLKYKTTA